MELLITPAQVATLAFVAPDFISPEAVPEATILAAQQKFVRPALGDALYDALCRGQYPSLLEEYIVPPLALYVKALMLPSLAVRTGAGGVVESYGANSARAGEGKLRAAIRRLRGDASALVRRAVDHIEASPADYPEYDPDRSALRRFSIAGGVVLDRYEDGKSV